MMASRYILYQMESKEIFGITDFLIYLEKKNYREGVGVRKNDVDFGGNT